MRNLKKVLSLALAMVMLLGMMVVGAGAATSFKDDDVIQNKEAVTVVSTIGVLQGVGDNTFNPKGTLTRAEAAVVIAKLDLGADAASALTATNAATFKDVAEGSGYGWAKAYIDYCAGSGYIVGDGNGNFLPGKTVTSVEFATMVSRMLGYRDKNEGLDDPAQWVIKATALARKAGLSTNIVMNSTEGMSRDEMAQMAFNALTAPMVEYEGLDITIGEVAITSKASVRLHSDDKYGGTTYTDVPATATTPIRLCEEKFPDLKLSRFDELDKFGRRCSVWKYKNLKIAGSEGTIVPDLAYCTKVTKDTVADWAKMEDLYAANYMELWINGQEMRDFSQPKDSKDKTIDYTKDLQAWIAWYTAPGREVEVYMKNDNLRMVERVVVVDTVLGEVTKENPDETISVKLMRTPNDKVTTGTVTLNTKVGYGDVKKGDIVLVQGYYNSSSSPEWRLNKDTSITSVEVAPIVTGFATFKGYSKQEDADYIKVDGTDYKDAYSVVKDYTVQDFDLNTENLDCTLYLDSHGNIMKAIEGKDPKAVQDNLIAVKETYVALSSGKIVNMVKGVLSNGESVDWQISPDSTVKEPGNHIYTWVKDTAKGGYKLSALESTTYKGTVNGKSTDVSAGTPSTAAEITFKANDVFGKDKASKVMYSNDVKFIFVNNEGVSILNGRQNYTLGAGKTLAQAYKDGEIVAVFMEDTPDIVDVSDIIYVHSAYRENNQIVDVDGKQVQYYGYTAYDSKGEPIEGFLGSEDNMWDSFNRIKKTNDGKAYMPANTATVQAHSMTKGVVAKANGLKGDAFVLVDAGKDGKIGTSDDVHYDFMGSKSTIVKDLSGSKLYIENVEELNEAVKDGYYVEVAAIYNAISNTPAQAPSKGDVRAAVTVFVTTVVKPDKDHVVPGHDTETPTDPTDPEEPEITGNVKPAKDEPVVVDGTNYGGLTIDRLGNLSLNVKFKAPKWAEGTAVNAAGDVAFDVTIKDDVGTVKKLSNGTVSLDNGVYSCDDFALTDVENAIEAGTIDFSKLTVEISNVKWKYANVKYVLGTTDVTGKTITGLTQSLTKLPVKGNGGTVEKSNVFTIAGATMAGDYTIAADAKYAITGAELAVSTDTPKLSDAVKNNATVTATWTTNGIWAKSNDFVTITITGVTEKVDTSTKYTVGTVASISGKYEFVAVNEDVTADATKVPTTGWNATAENITGKYVLIRAKDGSKITTLDGSNFQDDAGATANTTVAQVGTTGVWQITMGSKNLVIPGSASIIATDAVEISKVYISKDMTKVNVIVTSGSGAEKVANAVCEFLKTNQTEEYNLKGVTAEVKYAGLNPDGTKKFDGLYLTKNGDSTTETKATVTATGTGEITLDGKKVIVVTASDDLDDIMAMQGMTATTETFLFVKKGANAVVAGNSLASTKVTAGDEYDTNEGAYYAQLDKTTKGVAFDADGKMSGGTPEAEVTGGNIFVASTETYAAIGKDLTVTITNGTTAITGSAKGIKVIADVGNNANCTAEIPTGDGAVVVAVGGDLDASGTKTITVKLLTANTAVNAKIGLKLADAT